MAEVEKKRVKKSSRGGFSLPRCEYFCTFLRVDRFITREREREKKRRTRWNGHIPWGDEVFRLVHLKNLLLRGADNEALLFCVFFLLRPCKGAGKGTKKKRRMGAKFPLLGARTLQLLLRSYTHRWKRIRRGYFRDSGLIIYVQLVYITRA